MSDDPTDPHLDRLRPAPDCAAGRTITYQETDAHVDWQTPCPRTPISTASLHLRAPAYHLCGTHTRSMTDYLFTTLTRLDWKIT